MNRTGYFFEPRKLRTDFPSHVQWSAENRLLSPPECDSIIQFGHLIGFGKAAIGSPGASRVDESYRCVEVATLPFIEKFDWLYQRLTQKVQYANDDFYGFDLSGLCEPLQLLRYVAAQDGGVAGHYDWHQDFGADYMGRRKLSVVINLSDPADYDGCRLTIMHHRQETLPYVGRGDAVLFPTWTPHMVSGVSRGMRYALACWVHGAPFR